jgi:ABC-type protease/lipase transport system fused ATPase/permease subunit
MTLGVPLVILHNYESVRHSQNIRFFVALFGVVAVIHLMQGLLRLLRLRLLRNFAGSFDFRYRYPAVVARFDGTCSPQAAAMLMLDVDRVQKFIVGEGLVVCFDLPWVLVFIAVLSGIDIWLGVMCLAFAAMTAAIAVVDQINRRNAPAGNEKYGSLIRSALTGSVAHRAFVPRSRFERMYRKNRREAARIRQLTVRIPDFLKTMSRTVKSIQGVVVLGLASYLTVQSHASVGIMMVAAFLAPRISEAFETLVKSWSEIGDARPAWNRLKHFRFAGPPIARPALPPSALKKPTFAVEFVSAGWPGSDLPLLSEVSFELSAGDILIIEGGTGSGKTVLAQALAGCCPPLSGRILMGGIDVAELPDEERIMLVGYLPQASEFYQSNLADNISGFAPKIDEKALNVALDQMGLTRFINPEKGLRYDLADPACSPGILQRAAIARAIYNSPRVLVFDDPTQHLDRDGLSRLRRVLVSHRDAGGISVLLTANADSIPVGSLLATIGDGRLAICEPEEIRVQRQ